jgi:next-to-BRCA1 protein 1
VLDPSDTAVFKKLARAARAKLKLRIKVVIPSTANGNALYALPNHHPALASEVTLANANDICNVLPSPQILSPLRLSTASDGLIKFPTTPNTTPLNVATTGSSAQSATNRYSLRTCRSDYMIEPFGQRDLAVRPKIEPAVPSTCGWSVYCNICDKPMVNEHYHCNICDDGDYDLCQTCVDAGHHCPGDGHWLIKRLVKNGQVINSTTETVSPKLKLNEPSEMPGAFTEEKKMDNEEVEEEQTDNPTRTCNACVNGKHRIIFDDSNCH